LVALDGETVAMVDEASLAMTEARSAYNEAAEAWATANETYDMASSAAWSRVTEYVSTRDLPDRDLRLNQWADEEDEVLDMEGDEDDVLTILADIEDAEIIA
jgi:glyoxylate utilization-related uncharacterized protein